ncbi:DUF6092 family protein [Streptomyces sp. NPDC089919]|uniref:DUF6092 family protein n=1 Tax=Streptomyces sp. NPDC089919 TaxID=3155188 RepID=UPI00344ACC72
MDPIPAASAAPRGSGTPTPLLLSEDDAVELLAYLVTSARTQLDEAAEYAPLRLLTAADRLAEAMGPQAGTGLRPLLDGIRAGIGVTSVRAGDPDGYVAGIDALCRLLATHLATRWETGAAT